ncbi:aerobic respiration two-component sensor histidine kinase ArcB [Oceanisphaera arctica]|uniref:Aerobic respiration control sensor protein n=1 Tax=Oceanisphaera arctica TaxID=641510 RepID=A0A2P5TKB4_9GAMM|nr:aerobic respiration two-component sensor histidine kinase ArcB [Oceanisphaera arctica]PPL15572.1 aerobic respiration two-component sensor histidine kinase ArcB [Oceanisphaera arctica]GHA25450.1 aerobic respiration control sensor protein [Oceanisphaera arctica]
MKPIKTWAQYYVDLMTKLGIVRFSMLLAACIILLAIFIQVGVTLFLRGTVESIDMVRSVFFGLLVTPWAVYFLSVVVDQLEDSRQRLSRLVQRLQQMRERDLELNSELQEKIELLNRQIEETHKAETARQQAIEDLEAEVYQREKAQMESQERSALLRSFIDTSPDLVYYRNELEEFSGCNRAMENLIGRQEKELIGLTPFDVYPADVAEKVVETDKEVFSRNETQTYEQWLQYPDGRRACFELRKVPFFDRNGKRLGLLGFGRDITERKRYQEELEKASRDKTTFISTISHELRTPLNGIVGLSRILLATRLDQEQRQHLKTIHFSAVTLGNIFNDIIDLDKVDRSRLELAPEPMDFPGFLDDLESLARLQAEQKGLYLHFDRDGDIPDWIMADGTRLRQVLWNLVGNAVKFTDDGGVTIRCMADELTPGEVTLRFDIEDTGIGIPTELQQKIFALYFQIEGNKHATGTGIGLAVSQQLVDAMHGTIELDSEPEEGSCFSITIKVPRTQAPVDDPVVAHLPPLSVLLVEDVELNVTVACALLEKLGHKVTVARDGGEAFAWLAQMPFDLVFLDIQLPDMTGFDIASRLREEAREQSKSLPPLVALTANVISDKEEYLAKGMDDAISKPLSSKAIKGVLARFFAHRPQPQAKSRAVAAPVIASLAIATGTEAHADEQQVLDTLFLTDYVDTVGAAILLSSVDMLDEMAGDYLSKLNGFMTEKDKDGIVEEAHKIKGAAGSVGLKRVQLLAQQIQSPELPDWWQQLDAWVNELNALLPADLVILRRWLESRV